MEYIWVNPPITDECEIPFGAKIIERLKKHLRVRDDNGKELTIPFSDVLRPMHSTCIGDVEDMIMMGDLQEYSILRNLELRYKKNLIYTYTGDVLIAVNPYQSLPIYGKDMLNKYRNRKLGELPPHLFAIGDISYENMRYNREKQCIIINGESGAGKTESARLLLHYYASVTGQQSVTEEQIIMSDPVLEEFGNAKTVRNGNSSRFGKYISINFNWDGKMEQARIKNFLLEKSRIVTHCKGERNFHIFYTLLGGLSEEEKNMLGLKEIPFYEYLAEDVPDVGRDKIAKFQNFRKALKILNFDEETIWNIFKLLAAILHLGNVKYYQKYVSGIEAVKVTDPDQLNKISSLLGTSSHYLKSCLTRKTIAALSEKVIKDLNKQEAIDMRDAFVKAIYGNLFNYVVKKINEAIYKNLPYPEGYIGILDIFGFENYNVNSFEQLCINLANEYLQQYFIYHTFKVEQNYYLGEGIDWECIDFLDNTSIIDMISGEPMNVISIINDLSKFPSSTDETLLAGLIERHRDNENFLTPKFNNIQTFGINHFAGVVLYDVKGFIEKNRDSCSSDFMDLARLSDNYLLKKIFPDYREIGRNSGEKKKRAQDTLISKFKNSLDELLSELNECHPFFVRCIKPNDLQKPNMFNRQLCSQQLRYSGMWETSKIRQAGYAVRYTYREFVLRYGLLTSPIPVVNHLTQDEIRKIAADICYNIFKCHLNKQFGFTRVFLKNYEYLKLEQAREKILSRFAVIVQKRVRNWICRKRFVALRRAVIVIQRFWRGRRLRRNYLIQKHGILRLQASIKMKYQIILYLHMRQVITRFQARCKGFVIRRKFYQYLQERGKRSRIDCNTAALKEEVHKPACKQKFTRPKPMERDSYLHGPRKARPTADNIENWAKLVDDSFYFLNDHSRPNQRQNYVKFK